MKWTLRVCPCKYSKTLYLWYNLSLRLSLYKVLVWFNTVWDQHRPAAPGFETWRASSVTLDLFVRWGGG